MQTSGVVIAVEENAQIGTEIFNVPVLETANFFLLQRSHEAFALGIVIGIARPAHAWDHSMLKQCVDISGRRILNATIGMMNQAKRGLSRFNGAPERH